MSEKIVDLDAAVRWVRDALQFITRDYPKRLEATQARNNLLAEPEISEEKPSSKPSEKPTLPQNKAEVLVPQNAIANDFSVVLHDRGMDLQSLKRKSALAEVVFRLINDGQLHEIPESSLHRALKAIGVKGGLKDLSQQANQILLRDSDSPRTQ